MSKTVEELEKEVEALKANIVERDTIIKELNEELSEREENPKVKSPTVKVGKDTFEITAPSVGVPAKLQAKYGATITAKELVKKENADLLKHLVEKKMGYLKKVS